MILKTRKYDMFIKHSSNRDLDNENLKRIKNSILFKNMLHLRPIVVNKIYEIIDGQHRLEVAKQLNLDIYYCIDEKIEDNDIIALNNNQKQWRLTDYLNFYCNQGNENYIKLKIFIEKNNIKDLINALIICGQSGSYYTRFFKRGEFKIPEFMVDSQNKFLFIKRVQDILDAIMVGKNRHFYKGSRFVKAIALLANHDEFDFSIFLKKLEGRLDSVHNCYTVESYMDMLKGIYNYRNPNPIV